MLGLFFILISIAVAAVGVIGGLGLLIVALYDLLAGPGEDPYDYPATDHNDGRRPGLGVTHL